MLDWSEHEAIPLYEDYFAERGIELAEGQFADVTLEWEAFHEDVARFVRRGLIVTLDYGYTARKLFHPRARRFGTAAAYSGHRVHSRSAFGSGRAGPDGAHQLQRSGARGRAAGGEDALFRRAGEVSSLHRRDGA